MPWKENTLENIRNDFIMEVEEKFIVFQLFAESIKLLGKLGINGITDIN